MPCKEHLKTALQAFGYLKNHAKGCICFDISFREEPEDVKVNRGWRDLYPLAKEKLLDDPPEPKGKPVKLTMEVDADHAHYLETRRSVTGFFLYINNTLQKWYSKRQHTVETST